MNKLLNLPTLLIISFLIRILINGATIGEAIVMLALSALYAGFYYLDYKKEPEANKEIRNKIVELEEQLKITKDKVNSVALGINLRK